jgi:nitroreductase
MVREKDGRIKIGRVMCLECGHCVALCPEGAIVVDEGPDFAEATSGKPEEGSATGPPPVSPEAFRELVRQRRSVRQYEARPVPRELLEQMLDNGRWAPTAANCQCQAFTVLTDPARRDWLSAQVVEFYRAYQEALQDREHAAERLAALGLEAGFALHPHMRVAVPSFLKNTDAGRDRLFFAAPAVIIVHADEGEVLPASAAAFATLTLALSAETLGLGTCITAYASEALRARPDLRAALEVPETHQVHYVLTVGYPAEHWQQVPPRRAAQVRWWE